VEAKALESKDAPRSEVRIGELALRFLVTHPGATVFECVIPSRARVPAPHYHREVDETLYGLSGALSVILDGTAHLLQPGEAFFIPRGAVHHHENKHAEDARFLAVLTPGTIGRAYFEEIAQIINAPGRPDMAQVKAVMLHHGLQPV
jgi:quercetin dioxygenase-like cupin family protein